MAEAAKGEDAAEGSGAFGTAAAAAMTALRPPPWPSAPAAGRAGTRRGITAAGAAASAAAAAFASLRAVLAGAFLLASLAGAALTAVAAGEYASGRVLLCGAAAALAFALLGWLLGHLIALPLHRLRQGVEEMSRGSERQRTAPMAAAAAAGILRAGDYAEARALSDALHALVYQRDQAQAALRTLADDLARQVSERAAESVRAAEEVRRSAAYLKALFQHAPFGLFVVSVLPGGRFRYDSANPAALALAGLDAEELQGRGPHDLLPPGQADMAVRRFRDCVATGAALSYDVTEDVPTGRCRDQHVTLVPVREGGAAVRGSGGARGEAVRRLLVCVQDVTERNRMEAALREAQRMDAVGRLAAGVAHDFNNMLQALMGNLELLGAHVAGDPWADAYVSAALQSAERGARLTHQMLSFSRRQFLRPRALPLAAVFDGMQRLLGPALGDAVRLELDLPPGLPPVLADPVQLEAALLNIALNARDAMPDGGASGSGGGGDGRILVWAAAVEVEATAAASTEASGAAAGQPELPAGRYVVLTLADTGRGMDAATLAHAFEPFFTTKGVGQGSGLGLSMVQGFARQSGGDVIIRSTPGQGTAVELWLPAAAAAAAARPTAAAAKAAGVGGGSGGVADRLRFLVDRHAAASLDNGRRRRRTDPDPEPAQAAHEGRDDPLEAEAMAEAAATHGAAAAVAAAAGPSRAQAGRHVRGAAAWRCS